MECPYCDQQLLGDNELNIHILREHPDKALTADNLRKLYQIQSQRNRQDTLLQIAARLTDIQCKTGVKQEEILATLKAFLRELMNLGPPVL